MGAVSTLDFLVARISTPAIDRRFIDVLIDLEIISTSVKSDSGVDSLVSSSRIGDEPRHVKGEERREGDGDRDLDLDRDVVGGVDRFGIGGIDKAGPGMMGDGGVTSGTVATGSSSQASGMSVWSEDMSSSRTFSEPVAGRVEIGETAALTASLPG